MTRGCSPGWRQRQSCSCTGQARCSPGPPPGHCLRPLSWARPSCSCLYRWAAEGKCRRWSACLDQAGTGSACAACGRCPLRRCTAAVVHPRGSRAWAFSPSALARGHLARHCYCGTHPWVVSWLMAAAALRPPPGQADGFSGACAGCGGRSAIGSSLCSMATGDP